MRHEPLAGALVELRKIAATSPGADRLFHHPPEACERVEVRSAVSRQAREAQLAMVVGKGRIELVRPLEPAASDDHPDFLRGFLKERHHLV